MTEDRTHPVWCDKSTCTTAESKPYGSHLSESHVVYSDPPVKTVCELHLVSTVRGLAPGTLLMLELDIDDEPASFPLTLRQARQLHAAIDKLLAAADG
jgi:hypothetical protein